LETISSRPIMYRANLRKGNAAHRIPAARRIQIKLQCFVRGVA
jgi:hypothetical protein